MIGAFLVCGKGRSGRTSGKGWIEGGKMTEKRVRKR